MTTWDALVFAYGVGWATATLWGVGLSETGPVHRAAVRVAAQRGVDRHVMRGWRIGVWLSAMVFGLLWPILVVVKITAILSSWIRKAW